MEALARFVDDPRKWPFLNEVKAIRETFPASDKELETFTEKAVLEIENAFQRVIKVPFACKNFENTFYAIDFAKAKAQSFGGILQVVAYTHTLSTIRQKALECLRLIQEVIIKYNSHNELYEACRSSRFNHRGQLEKIKAIEERLTIFEVEGAHLNQEERGFCLALKKEIKKLETEFLRNLDEDDTSVWILNGDLEGVSKKLIESFDKQGAFYRIPCDTNTYYAVMCFCENERTRKRVFLAYNKRSHQKNLPILHELIKKRTALAKMLGFPSYAHLDLSDQLLKKPEEVDRFLSSIEEAVKPSSETEIKEVLAKLPGRFLDLNNKIKPWNMPYIYALGRGYACLEDDEELKKYFSLSQAFPKILTYLAFLFNINLILRTESIWEGVNFLVEARDENHLLLGHIVYDLYPRKGKYGHALCLDVVPPLIIDSKRMPALAVILANIAPPNNENFTLLTLDEISTLLHETGHALHELFGACHMPTKAGYRTSTDFLEMPPILLENLIYERDFLLFVGQHYKTGGSLNEAFLSSRKASKKFGLGYTLQTQTALSMLSLRLFWQGEEASSTVIREGIYEKVQPLISHVEKHHFEATFRHIADPLYGAKYYGFLYALGLSYEVYNRIQHDPKKEWFRFRKIVLEKGGSGNPLEALTLFLGKAPSIKAFLDEIR